MQPVTTIHYDGITPAFQTFGTVQAAESYLRELIISRQVSPCDSISIIRISDDSVLYFRQHNNTVANLHAGLHPRRMTLSQRWQSVNQLIQDRLLIAFSAFTDVVGRL